MRKSIDVQKENVDILIKLMKENPMLRVIPMVDSDVIRNDGYSCWSGEFGKAAIDECWCDEERIYFKSLDDDDLKDMALEGMEDQKKFTGLSDEQLLEIAKKEVNALDWEKVIVIGIYAQ